MKRPPILVLGKDEDWPVLTREAILASCREGVCPFCGRDSLSIIGLHFHHSHGVSADQVRKHYGFVGGQSYAASAYTARRAELTRAMMRKRHPKGHHAPSVRKEIARRWQAGESMAALARAYGAKQNLISRILAEQEVVGDPARRLRYHHYVLTAAQEAEIGRRCLAGESRQALAAEFACASSFVDYLVRHRRRELTASELEVLRLLATNTSPAQIAVQLHLTAQTVRMCASRIYHKLDVRSRAEAVRKAVELHLIEESG